MVIEKPDNEEDQKIMKPKKELPPRRNRRAIKENEEEKHVV